MLEGVTLAQVVELVVEVLVDLASGTVADEETTENTHAAHPKDLARRSLSVLLLHLEKVFHVRKAFHGD